MIPDPNWLLSTVVQSAAAFVAIVAGFIISKLLALSAERSGLQAKVRDMKLQLGIKKQNLDVLEKRLLEWDVEDFLKDSDLLDMFIESRGQISLAEAIKQVKGCNRSEDELRPYWDEAITVTKNAFYIVKDKFAELVESGDIDVFLKNLGVNLSSYNLEIYHRVFGQILNEYEERQNPSKAMMNLIVSSKMPDIHTVDEINRYRALEQDIETIGRDSNALETQLTDLEVQLKQLGQPQGVKLGIIFLAYFSLVGIIIPVFLLPVPPEKFTPIHKWGVFILFVSGLVFFFIYLFKLIRQLIETSNVDKSA